MYCHLSISNFAQKLPNGFAWNFQGRLAMVKFWWRSRSDPHCNTGKMCLDGGMNCPRASSSLSFILGHWIFLTYLIVRCPWTSDRGMGAIIGTDYTGAMGTSTPVLFKVLGQEYSFAPVLFGLASFNTSMFYCNLHQCLPLFCQILNIANGCFLVLAEAFWKLQNLQNSSAAWAPPWTPLGELTTFLQTP